jgi:hypothetical protein
VTENFSSDEESEDQENEYKLPSIKDVLEHLWDEKTIVKCVNSCLI